jgi:hypothetical protein
MGADTQKSESAQLSTLIGLGLAIAMVCVGVAYSGENPSYCQFGAVTYLYYGGIISLIANGIGILSSLGKWCAMRDGHISAGESCALGILGFAAFIVLIAELVVLIWGSVVVFGNYAEWIYEAGTEGKDGYCDYTPMMFAFVLLILKWILMPLTIVCACLCACCCAASAS